MNNKVKESFWNLIREDSIQSNPKLAKELTQLSDAVTMFGKQKKNEEIASVLQDMSKKLWKFKNDFWESATSTEEAFKNYVDEVTTSMENNMENNKEELDKVKKEQLLKDIKEKDSNALKKKNPKISSSKKMPSNQKSFRWSLWFFSTFINEIKTWFNEMDFAIQHAIYWKKETPKIIKDIKSWFKSVDDWIQYLIGKYLPFWTNPEKNIWEIEWADSNIKSEWESKEKFVLNKDFVKWKIKWKSKEEVLNWLGISSRIDYSPEKNYSQGEFLSLVTPLAKEIEHKFWIPKDIVLAQAWVESNFGKSDLLRSSNNVFGTKSGFWRKGSTKKLSGDWISWKFKEYGSIEQSFYDYAKSLQRRKYRKLFKLDKKDTAWRAQWLEKAWFSKEENYAETLLAVLTTSSESSSPKTPKNKSKQITNLEEQTNPLPNEDWVLNPAA